MCHTNNLKRKNITLAKKFLGRDPPEVRYVHFHRKMQTILMVIVKLMNLMSLMSSYGQVLPYIDGFNPTCRIAVEADVEINLVKSCLQNLL